MYIKTKNKFLRFYLIGLKGFIETLRRSPSSLTRSLPWLQTLLAFTTIKYTLHALLPEFDRLAQPNAFIPLFVYESRSEHFRFWELSRLRRGKSTCFSFYHFEPKNQNLFLVDRLGNQKFEKNTLELENPLVSSNVLFEDHVRAFRHSQDQGALEKGTLLFGYERFRSTRFDIQNHLFYKPVTLGDWVRSVYYFFMTRAKFTNHYRFDHIVPKPDWLYNYEKVKLALNVNCKDFKGRAVVLQRIWDGYFCAG